MRLVSIIDVSLYVLWERERIDMKNLRQLLKMFVAVVLCTVLIFPVNIQVSAAGSLDQQIEDAQEELNTIKEQQSSAAITYDQGTMGFIDWMLAKSNLTGLQKTDLNKAKSVLQSACEEDFSKWYGGDNTGLPEDRNNKVTVLGDKYDAVSLENTKQIFWMLNQVNELRDTDENFVGNMKRNPAKTNFYFMAVAQTGADRGAGLQNHSLLQVSCENLSFGGSNPVSMWYSELSSFNKIKSKLGYSNITTEDQLNAVENRANEDGVTIGHYTNLFWAADQVMGIGYTSYRGTGCFNASKLSNYSSSYATYTIAEFESLFDQYYETVDPALWQSKVDAAEEKLEGLLEQRYENCEEHVFGDGTDRTATCTQSGGTEYTCTKCGYTKIENEESALGHDFTDGVCSRCGITGPKEVKYVWWSTGPNSTSSVYDQEFEVGYESEIEIYYTSASKYKYDDKFVVDIADPDIVSYTPDTNCTGVMHMNKIGETTVTIYPQVNPDMKKVYTVSVTDVGGHDYVISKAQPGSGITSKTCSKCGMVKDVTIPTAITNVIWWKGGSGTYGGRNMEVGDAIDLEVRYTPSDVDNHECVVTSSDETIVKVETGKNSYNRYYSAQLQAVGTGDVTIRVALKYDPSVYLEYKINVADEGGHDFVINQAEEGSDHTTEVCTKCGYVKELSLPTGISYVRWTEGSTYTYSPTSYETGAEVSLYVYDKGNADIHEYEVTSSNPDIVQVTSVSGRSASLSMVGTGEVTITISGKYNPWLKMEYTVDITEIGGHSYTVQLACDEALASPATCTAAARYYYSCDYCGKINKKGSTFASGNSLGHAYKPEYIWSSNGTTCTLKLVCEHDSNHVKSYTMNVSSSVKRATCEEDGAKTCIATYAINRMEYTDTKVIKINKTGHKWNSGEESKVPKCYEEGERTYTCIVCGKTRKEPIPIVEHSFVKKIVADDYIKTSASESSPAEYFYACSYCGKKGDNTYFYGDRIRTDISGGTVTLDKSTYVYDKTAKKPKVTVMLKGRKLTPETDYTVRYTGNVNAGTASVIVIGAGDYKGTLTTSFVIKKAAGKISLTSKYLNKYVSGTNRSLAVYSMVKTNCGTPLYTSSNSRLSVSKGGKVTVPARYIGYTYITIKTNNSNYTSVSARILVKIKAVPTSVTAVSSPSKNAVKLTWKKVALCDGYQVQYSQYKTFPSGKYRLGTVKGNTKSGAVIKGSDKLRSGKVYYMRVRTYRYQSGAAKKSDWSKTIAVRVK